MTTQPTQQGLPELPAPHFVDQATGDSAYSGDQMRAYAQAAIESAHAYTSQARRQGFEAGAASAVQAVPQEPDMAHPQYKAGWNDAVDLLTRSMIRVNAAPSAPAAPAATSASAACVRGLLNVIGEDTGDDVGALVYNGNTVSFIAQRAKVYGDEIMACWTALRDAGLAGGGSKLHEAVRAALAAQQPAGQATTTVTVDLPPGLSRSDAEFWLRKRGEIIDALRAEGLTMVTTLSGVKFMRLGKVEAQSSAQPPQAAEVPDDERRKLAPKAFREPEPGTPWWQTAKDCGAWTDRNEGDLGYIHFGSTEALRVFAGKIARQAEAAQEKREPLTEEQVFRALEDEARRLNGGTLDGLQMNSEMLSEVVKIFRIAERAHGITSKGGEAITECVWPNIPHQFNAAGECLYCDARKGGEAG